MVTIFKPVGFVLASAITLLTASYGVHASDQVNPAANPHVFKAGRGVSLDVGSKKVAGTYVSKDGNCDVTLMVADLPDADGHVTEALTRINVPVKSGTNAHVYTSEGKALELYCTLGSKLMTLRALDQTASVAK